MTLRRLDHARLRAIAAGIPFALAICAASAQVSPVHENLTAALGRYEQRLQWTYVVPDSERVMRNGIPLHRNVDYLFNADLGMLRFLEPLSPGDSVSLDYDVRPGQSQQAAKQSFAPIETNLFATNSTSLGLVANLRGDASGYVGAKGLFRTGGGWSLSAQYLVASKDPQPGVDSHMLRLGLAGGVLGGNLTASMDTAGAGFTDAAGLGARAGASVFAANWATKSQGGAAFIKFREEAPQGADANTVASGGFDVRLSKQLDLKASRNFTSLGERVTNKDSTTLSFTPSRFLSLAADWNGEAGKGGATSLRLYASDKIATVNASRTMPDSHGNTMTDVSSDLRLLRGIRVQSTEHVETGANLADTKLWWEPGKQLGLAATYLSSPNGIFSDAAGVEMRWKPTSALEVSGTGRRREQPDKPDALDTVGVNVTLAPVQGLKVTGAYADRPEDKTGMPQPLAQRSVGANVSLGSLFVGGSYAQSMGLQDDSQSLNYQVEGGLRFSRTAQLKLSYGRQSSLGATVADTRYYGVGFEQRAGLFSMTLEGRLTQPYQDGAPLFDQRKYEARASLGLRF